MAHVRLAFKLAAATALLALASSVQMPLAWPASRWHQSKHQNKKCANTHKHATCCTNPSDAKQADKNGKNQPIDQQFCLSKRKNALPINAHERKIISLICKQSRCEPCTKTTAFGSTRSAQRSFHFSESMSMQNKSTSWPGKHLLTALAAATLAACGGGKDESPDTHASSSSQQAAMRSADINGATTTDATPFAATSAIVVHARSTLAQNIGAIMVVRVNGVEVGRQEVRATTFQPYTFNAGMITTGSSVDVAFTNDSYAPPEDRNLYVQSIAVDGQRYLPTDTGVSYDLGAGEEAFDGRYQIPGREDLLFLGALRFHTAARPSELRMLRWRTGADAKSSSWGDPSWEDKAALYRMVYSGVYGYYVDSNGHSTLASTMRTRRDNIRAKSQVDTLVGNYVIDYEIQDWEDKNATATEFPGFKEASRWVKSNNAWLRKTPAYGGGRTAWTDQYHAWNLNTYADPSRQVKDTAGDAVPEAFAKIYFDTYFKSTGLDWVFHDNSITQNLGDENTNPGQIDYLLDGRPRRATDPEVQAGFHANQRRKLDRYEALAAAAGRPPLLHIGNIGNAAFDQLSNNITGAAAPDGPRWHGANMEGGFGLFWSADAMAGWSAWHARVKAVLGNLREPKLLSVVNTVQTLDHQMLNYGFASSLLFDHVLYFTHVESLGRSQHAWYQLDEYLIRLGDKGSEPEPTAPTQNGIWTRKYPGGMVIVNPNDNKGRPLRAIHGGVDRLRNNITLTRRGNEVQMSGFTNHGLSVGQKIRIVNNYNAPSFNGEFTLTTTDSAAGTASWSQTGQDLTSSGGYGAISVASSIDLTGQGYRFYGAPSDLKVGDSKQRPEVNTGEDCSVVSVWSSDGLIVVRK